MDRVVPLGKTLILTKGCKGRIESILSNVGLVLGTQGFQGKTRSDRK